MNLKGIFHKTQDLTKVLFYLFSDACHGLAFGLGECLRFFNDHCSAHLFKEGKPSFTAETIGEICSQKIVYRQ